MKHKSLVLAIALCGLSIGWSHLPFAEEQETAAADQKRIIGQTVRVRILESSSDFLARVDTGAATTSLHAESVQVKGDMVDFITINHEGDPAPMRLPLSRVGSVRNSGGTQERVYVQMTVAHEGRGRRICVNLSDRSAMTYPLLLGRNWLEDNYVVDVSQEPELPGSLAANDDDGRRSLSSH